MHQLAVLYDGLSSLYYNSHQYKLSFSELYLGSENDFDVAYYSCQNTFQILNVDFLNVCNFTVS